MCEAYSTRPSAAAGLFDPSDPDHLYDALHFDMAVRMRANLAAQRRRDAAQAREDEDERRRSDAEKGLSEAMGKLAPDSPYRRHLERITGGRKGG